MPTIFVNWIETRSPEAYPQVASAIAEAVSGVPGAGAPTPEQVIVYFDVLAAGELYVDGARFEGWGERDG
jgi:phenylpyruvate tautomerase PptA (4-oxalocrotonate tautomerase family)